MKDLCRIGRRVDHFEHSVRMKIIEPFPAWRYLVARAGHQFVVFKSPMVHEGSDAAKPLGTELGDAMKAS